MNWNSKKNIEGNQKIKKKEKEKIFPKGMNFQIEGVHWVSGRRDAYHHKIPYQE